MNWVDNAEGKTFPASSCHDTTDTKSATKGGTSHLNTAELPLITYSRPTSLLYGSRITVHDKKNVQSGQKLTRFEQQYKRDFFLYGTTIVTRLSVTLINHYSCESKKKIINLTHL